MSAYYTAGENLLRLGQKDLAIKAYEKVFNDKDVYPDTLKRISSDLEKTGETVLSKQFLDKANEKLAIEQREFIE